MNPITLWILLLLALPHESFSANSRVRRVYVQQDEIVTVKTALGVATIIQVPDRPNSLVVGDTESFKVEYLDQAITIKPLHPGAKSNLYIYTDWRRFNVQLVAANESQADYVVYLDVPKEKVIETKPSIRWMQFRNQLQNGKLTLQVTRLGRTKDGVLIIEFKIKGSQRGAFDPKWLWLTQQGQTRPIHRLMISRLEIDPREPIEGMVQVMRSDLREAAQIRLELRRERVSYLTIPEVTAWK